MRSFFVLLTLLAVSSEAFVVPSRSAARPGTTSVATSLSLHQTKTTEQEDDINSDLSFQSSRRDWLSSVVVTAGTACSSLLFASQPVSAADAEKVLVLGGTGFVGSRVVSTLRNQGVTVVATSRDGRDGTVALDVLTESDVVAKVKELAAGCTAVVSCIGAIGGPADDRVNAASGLAAQGAKAAGVPRFVAMGVAPQVNEWASTIGPLQPYVTGKSFARKSIVSNYATPVLIEPTFIHGGDKFSINPPRVASFYGKFIEGILSSAPIRGVEGVMPAGFIKIALEPPVSVDSVARAAAAGALGLTTSVLDTYDKIQEASKLL